MDKILISDLRSLLDRLDNDETFRKLVTKWFCSEYDMSDYKVDQLFLMLREICMDEDAKDIGMENIGGEFEEPLITLLSVYNNQCG